jgi:small subunit ribosomal protein S5
MARRREQREERKYEQRVVDLARVTRVMAGGKRMRFRACVVIGDRKGKVGYAIRKGADVSIAVEKAVKAAQKDMLRVPIVNETIPHEVTLKFKASRIILRPAVKGRGVVSGGAVRDVLEMAGVPNVVSKILGTNNKVSNVKATMLALAELRDVKTTVARRKGTTAS